MRQVRIVRGWAAFAFYPCLVLISGLADGGDAPEVEWIRSLSLTVEEGLGTPLEETSDGGFILSGYTLKKTDERGHVLWETSFEMSGG